MRLFTLSGKLIRLRQLLRLKYVALMIRGQKKSELVLYLVLWLVLFAAPVLSMYVGDFFTSSSDSDFTDPHAIYMEEWDGVWNAWRLLSVFCITFLLHNFLIAPLLVYSNHKWRYGVAVCVLIAVFACCQTYVRSQQPEPPKEELAERPAPPQRPDDMRMPPPDFPGEMDTSDRPPKPKEHTREPSHVLGGQDSVAFIIMILLLGLNVGFKYFFKSLDDRKRMKELERENLSRQLDYLKYQINPHFFMNTLNNIHALIDIDPEQASSTIETLSKLMRYVLYEGNKPLVPLQKELDFISHYVELMRIRYTDKVRISVSLPRQAQVADSGEEAVGVPKTNLMDVQVPSLLFATFLENAFKHGVSYKRTSFIEVCIMTDDTSREVEFLCHNSKKPESEDKHGGVGLRNAVERLRLIYGRDGYTLKIDETEESYRVLIRLPFKPV